jgi:hypothetical protein
MSVSNAEKEVLVRGTNSASAGEATLMKLSQDEHGWPLVSFEPANSALNLVGDFLRSDVDILLSSCDLLLESIQAVVADRQAHWRWNGNSFIVEIEKSLSRLTDKYGEALGDKRCADVPTLGLRQIIQGWRDFVSVLPRQQEFQLLQAALEQERGGGDSEGANSAGQRIPPSAS